MTELFIDNKRAYPKDGINIKLTAQNVFFTKSASYTLDIELPLEIEENRKIFGFIDRMDVSKQKSVFDARLLIDNQEAIIGIATITQANEQSVKVQLLGGSSAYNYRNNLDEKYIDELVLGDFAQYTAWDGATGSIMNPPWGVFTNLSSVSNSVYGHNYPFVAYPIRNSNADVVLNDIIFCRKNGNAIIRIGLSYSDIDPETQSMYMETYIAFQPYLWHVAKMIAQATGFSLADSDNVLFTDPFYYKIFLANANTTPYLALMLPHWSVNEWWSHLENAFGVVTVVDYNTNKMWLKSRKNYFSAAQVVKLEEVVDEYTANVGDDTEEDISTSNVGFSDFENGKEDLLSDYIMSNAQRNTTYPNLDALLLWGKSANMSAYKGTLFECQDGRQYIYTENTLGEPAFVEVNMFRPRIVKEDNSEVDIELKFVPAHYADHEVKVFEMGASNLLSIVNQAAYVGTFPMKIMEKPDVSELNDTYSGLQSIEDLISGDEEEDTDPHEEVPDVIYIGIENEEQPDSINPTITRDDKTQQMGMYVQVPRAYIRERGVARLTDNISSIEDAPFSLSLIDIAGQTNLAKSTIKDAPAINADVLYTIQFVSDEIPDTNSVFLIRNKKFVCQRIEAEAESKGMKKLMTGYFYELS